MIEEVDRFVSKASSVWTDQAEIICYTCILGGVDHLDPPENPDDDVTYVCFTDNPELTSDVWHLIKVPDLVNNDPRLTARILKLSSHRIFPRARFTIWLDGQCRLIRSLIDQLVIMEKQGDDFHVCRHQRRQTVFWEMVSCFMHGQETLMRMLRQYMRYRRDGFRDDQGLAETGILFRRGGQANSCFNEAWLFEVMTKSVRDQLSFPFVLWRSGKSVRIVDEAVDDFAERKPHKHIRVYGKNGSIQVPLILSFRTIVKKLIKR